MCLQPTEIQFFSNSVVKKIIIFEHLSWFVNSYPNNENLNCLKDKYGRKSTIF